MLDQLARGDRLRLMKFVCSFAWSDLKVRPAERAFVERLVRRLDLDLAERSQVDAWLELPPPPEEIDPTLIPAEQRKLFVEAITGLVVSDDEMSDEEHENLKLLRQLLV